MKAVHGKLVFVLSIIPVVCLCAYFTRHLVHVRQSSASMLSSLIHFLVHSFTQSLTPTLCVGTWIVPVCIALYPVG